LPHLPQAPTFVFFSGMTVPWLLQLLSPVIAVFHPRGPSHVTVFYVAHPIIRWALGLLGEYDVAIVIALWTMFLLKRIQGLHSRIKRLVRQYLQLGLR